MQTKTQSVKPLTTADQQELKSLKKLINEGHDTVEQMKSKLKDDGNKILTEAILEGDRLNKVKKLVLYGSFGRWLKDNCKKISIRTAQRYMTLATRKSELLETDVGLRKAYALLGIIKENDSDGLDGESINSPVPQSTTDKKDKAVSPTLAAKAAAKARNVKTALPMIQKSDALSRAKYLASELTIELNSKIINKLIMKADARQIVQPLIALTT